LEKKKTHKLVGDFKIPFSIYAISCTENQIKTVWNINKSLEINLCDLNTPITAYNSELFFPVFSDKSTFPEYTFNLIGNKSQEALLVKELPNIDFILEIIGEMSIQEKNAFIIKLKKMQGITAVIEVNPDRIKRRAPFVSI